VKTEPAAGVAVRVRTSPNGNCALQLAQDIPAGELEIVPVPVPVPDPEDTPKVFVIGVGMKVAVTCISAFKVTLQAPVPLQAPPQPEKVVPPCNDAESETVVPAVKV
jgi:hypothetical protein